jgi:hypothetical protein
MPQITEHVTQNIPRCLTNVDASPINDMLEDRGTDFVTFRLSNDGATDCRVIGHDLNYDDESHAGPLEYVSPITLQWKCGSQTQIFDSEIHGYSGEMESSAKIHRVGAESPYKCNKCETAEFVVDVQFNYHDDLFDEFEAHEVSNYFNNIIIRGTCSNCSNACCIVDMDL